MSCWTSPCSCFISHNAIGDVIPSFDTFSSNILLKTFYILTAAIAWHLSSFYCSSASYSSFTCCTEEMGGVCPVHDWLQKMWSCVSNWCGIFSCSCDEHNSKISSSLENGLRVPLPVHPWPWSSRSSRASHLTAACKQLTRPWNASLLSAITIVPTHTPHSLQHRISLQGRQRFTKTSSALDLSQETSVKSQIPLSYKKFNKNCVPNPLNS